MDGQLISAKTGQVIGSPPLPPSQADLLAAARAAMSCTPAQMRLVLLTEPHPDDSSRTLLAYVNEVVAADPAAEIVWEYATRIVRTSPFIDSLGNRLTPEQIDDLFRAAVKLLV